MKRVVLVLLAMLTGCAAHPSVVRNVVLDPKTHCYMLDGKPMLRKDTGACWREMPR